MGPVLAVSALLARAGGGQHFSPPQRSGGGGGGGGGGFHLGGFFFLPFLLGGGGLLFLILIAVVGYFILRSMRGAAGGRGGGAGGGSGSSFTAAAPPPPATAMAAGRAAGSPYDDSAPIGVPDRFRGATLSGTDPTAAGPGGRDEGLAQIRAHDAAFDESAFISQVERAFFVIQQAWSEQRPEMARAVMADGLWQQHRAQIEQMAASGERNMLDGLTIGNAAIIGAHSDPSYDTLTVRIAAASADYQVDGATGRYRSGSRDFGQWTEDWVFQRSSQAQTKVGGGTLNQKCPNCGAPLDVDLAGVCGYCKAPIMGGAYDWVLTRIDQVQPAYF